MVYRAQAVSELKLKALETEKAWQEASEKYPSYENALLFHKKIELFFKEAKYKRTGYFLLGYKSIEPTLFLFFNKQTNLAILYGEPHVTRDLSIITSTVWIYPPNMSIQYVPNCENKIIRKIKRGRYLNPIFPSLFEVGKKDVVNKLLENGKDLDTIDTFLTIARGAQQ